MATAPPTRVNTISQGTVTVNPASIAAGAIGNVDLAIAGALTGWLVILFPPATLEAGLVPVGATVTATGTVRLRLFNPTAAPIDGASLVWHYVFLKPF